MTVRNLDHLFKPSSVALIGASERAGSVGNVVLGNLRGSGFQDEIILVNPKYATVAGLPCVPTVAALPATPDLAVIATPAATVPDLVDQLARRGTKAVIVLSAGFGDAAGARLKQAMLNASAPHLVRLV